MTDLRLMTYNTVDDILWVLENRFGNQTAIAFEVAEELQRLPVVKSHQPKELLSSSKLLRKLLKT